MGKASSLGGITISRLLFVYAMAKAKCYHVFSFLNSNKY
jgi:hypothetical protein